MMDVSVTCNYCGKPAELDRARHGWVWRCVPCDAWVGVNPTSPSKKPIGSLANAELRKARASAHAAFDPMINAARERQERETGKVTGKLRAMAYEWLAGQLGITPSECHFSRFDLRLCKMVVEVCDRYTPPFMKQ